MATERALLRRLAGYAAFFAWLVAVLETGGPIAVALVLKGPVGEWVDSFEVAGSLRSGIKMMLGMWIIGTVAWPTYWLVDVLLRRYQKESFMSWALGITEPPARDDEGKQAGGPRADSTTKEE